MIRKKCFNKHNIKLYYFFHQVLCLIMYTKVKSHRFFQTVLNNRVNAKINKKYSKAYYKLGLLLVAESKFKDAMKNFEYAIANDPNFAEAHYQIALLLMDDAVNKILRTSSTKKAKSKN